MMMHSIRKNAGVQWLAWILSLAVISFGGAPAAVAAEICGPNDLADAPLELLGGSGPPPLFMVILDNTATMTYEVMTGGAGNGQLPHPDTGALLGWVYKTTQNVNAPVVENFLPAKQAWKGQWHGYNKLFYNPTVAYNPWPRWVECANAPAGSIDQPSNRQPNPPDATTNGANAHPDTPRWEPTSNANTYDLRTVWETIQYIEKEDDELQEVIVDETNVALFSKTVWNGGAWSYHAKPTAYPLGSGSGWLSDQNGTYWPLWRSGNVLDPAKRYDLFAWWDGNNIERSISVTYWYYDWGLFNYATAPAQNQRINGGRWNRLAQSVAFPSGEGAIDIIHTRLRHSIP
jgi:hypothetical protein